MWSKIISCGLMISILVVNAKHHGLRVSLPSYPQSFVSSRPEILCRLQAEHGQCMHKVLVKLKRYYFDLRQGCTAFFYSGCNGNANNFEDMNKCMETCGRGLSEISNMFVLDPEVLCRFQPEMGKCKSSQTQYYFDLNQGCKSFTYGGCQGNLNKFSDVNQCKRKCPYNSEFKPYPGPNNENVPTNVVILPPYPNNIAIATQPQVMCSLQPETGECRKMSQMFYYSTNDMACKQFIYGGCNGNPNRFANSNECLNKCARTPPYKNGSVTRKEVLCRMQGDKGTCRGLAIRFYYDIKLSDCIQFDYGGCNGNQNRFETIEECRRTCSFGKQSYYRYLNKKNSMSMSSNVGKKPKGYTITFKTTFTINDNKTQAFQKPRTSWSRDYGRK